MMTHHRLFMRLALSVLLLVLCSGAATAQDAPTVITLWHIATEGDPFRPVLQGAIDAYNASHTDIQIEARAIENDAIKAQLLSAVAENQPPDVFQTWGGGQLAAYVQSGVVRDIPELSGEAGGRFLPNALLPSTVDGRRYAVPANLAGVFLWVNEALFNQHNVALPATWDELLTACQTFRSAGVTPVALGNRDKWSGAFWFDYLTLRIGGSDAVARALAAGDGAALTEAPFVEAGRRVQEAVSAGCFQDGFNDADFPSSQAMLANGQAAMQLMGDWNLGSLVQINPDLTAQSIRALPFPAVEGGAGSPSELLGGTGQAFAISSSAPPETAQVLLDLFGSDAYGTAVAQAGFLPALAGHEDALANPIARGMAESLSGASRIQLYFDQSLPPELAGMHLYMTHELFGGRLTPETAAQLMADEASMETVALDAAPLRQLADARGLAVGTAVAITPLRHDAQYAETLRREFNVLVAETEMKMGPLRPNRETFAFDDADYIVDFAEQNGMRVRGHTLVWHNQQPQWVESGGFSRDDLIAVLEEHIRTVVERYRGRIYAWDVVNEAVDEDGSMRANVWYRTIGAEYIDLAFQWAHEADPDALLFYNDYDAEGLGAKSDAVYALVSGMVERGVPIHGVGLQMHISIGEPPSMDDIRANIERLNALGLQVQITELDVQIQNGAGTEAERFEQQAALYREVATICVQAPSCTALLTWGFTDQYTWIPGYTGNADAPLPFSTTYQPKPAYFALHSVLAGQ